MKLLPGSNNLLATWTAPGGDYDEGSVASYRFVYSEDIGDLLKPDRRPKILLAFDRMEEAGTDSSYDFEFPHYDADFYVAAYGFDTAGNKGKISNLVHVRVPSPPKATNPVYGDEDSSSSSSPIFSLSGGTNSDLDWIMIGVIAGVVGVLLVLSVVAISYYFVAARNGAARRRAAASTHQGPATATKKGGMLPGAAGTAAPGSGSGSPVPPATSAAAAVTISSARAVSGHSTNSLPRLGTSSIQKTKTSSSTLLNSSGSGPSQPSNIATSTQGNSHNMT